MRPFEEELKRALARREPSEDFAGRVLARVQQGESAKPRRSWFRLPRMWALAAAMALLLLPGGAGFLYQRHERSVRGEQAKQQLLLALRIAGSKLHETQQHVMQVERMEIE